ASGAGRAPDRRAGHPEGCRGGQGRPRPDGHSIRQLVRGAVAPRVRPGRGYVAEREGAVWFTSTELGDERDHVLIRSNGVPTYLAGDIPYHRDKLVVRGFDCAIDIWGADHHGHVAGMVAAIRALGIEPSRLEILLHQFVTMKRGDEIVKMSKRAGDYVALRDVLDEVGRDACRYFFLSRSANAHVEFDLELAKRQ